MAGGPSEWALPRCQGTYRAAWLNRGAFVLSTQCKGREEREKKYFDLVEILYVELLKCRFKKMSY